MDKCPGYTFLAGKPTSLAGIRFLELLKEDAVAFDNLYCVAFQMMDAQWLAKHASYMEFNVNNFYCILVYRIPIFEQIASSILGYWFDLIL